MARNFRQPRKSLRTLLMMWLIMFSVVPLAFVTGYSLVKYEQAIDQELAQRLTGNRREIEVILKEFRDEMTQKTNRHSSDSALIVYLTSRNSNQVRERASQLMKSHFTSQMQIFDRDGLAQVSLFRTGDGDIQRRQGDEQKVQLTDGFLKKLKDRDELMTVDIVSEKKIDLISFAKIRAPNGNLVGYIEEFVTLDSSFLTGLKNRLNIEVMIFSEGDDGAKRRAVATHPDLRELEVKQSYFSRQYKEIKNNLFELSIRDTPYGFMVQDLEWGDAQLFIAIGASKQAVKAVLANVNYAFFTVVGAIVFLLVVLSLVMSRVILRPVNDLLAAIEKVDADGSIPEVPSTSDNELGLLIDSFNQMSLKVRNSQRMLKGKITELEESDEENRDNQAKLVHTAKMASLGQLVAGIAHELNNPISFIYSNVSHLSDYGKRLIHLVEVAKDSPEKLEEEKEKVEFDYIVKDLPKLIQSCEEGARRTRDIVLGLRNFSRLDEAKVKEVDIHEGIDSTLDLLSGEMKPRILVNKNYGKLPKVVCYPSQLNQVFMNIITNAIHAIKKNGEITITTQVKDKRRVEISIRDTGVGMSQDVQAKLFDPFFTTKGVNQGTGLGMSITYGIIEKHGGEISVRSKVGQGTEFIILLPIKGT
jgi:two-component system, NtrC family, sensor kinase